MVEMRLDKASTVADTSTTLSDADKQVVIGSFDAAGRPVDVIFSFDTTGSMHSCLDTVSRRHRCHSNALFRECCQ